MLVGESTRMRRDSRDATRPSRDGGTRYEPREERSARLYCAAKRDGERERPDGERE